MVRLALITAFALLSTAPAIAGPEVGGTYTVKGTNFDGSVYTGVAKITPSSNSTCRIEWKTGGTTSTGFCMRNEDSLAAAYKLGSAVGLVIYHIDDDGRLDGVWTIADKAGAGTEVLTPR